MSPNPLHAAHANLVYLRTTHDRLSAARPSDTELEALRQADAEAQRLRAEAAELRARAAAVTPAPKPAAPPPKPPAIPVAASTDAGRATPAAALESVLWSSAHGEVEALATLLAFEPGTQVKIDEALASLPEEERSRYGSSADVFATLVAARMPPDLAQTEVLETTPGAGVTAVRLRLRRTDGNAREATFRFKQDTDGWRLIVPTRVVNDYLRMLTGQSRSGG